MGFSLTKTIQLLATEPIPIPGCLAAATPRDEVCQLLRCGEGRHFDLGVSHSWDLSQQLRGLGLPGGTNKPCPIGGSMIGLVTLDYSR